jgi:hypothetical protein
MPITYASVPGLSLYVRFDDASNTAYDLTEGATLKSGLYSVADATIDNGLASGEYTARILVGTAAGQSASDVCVGSQFFAWDGSQETGEYYWSVRAAARALTAADNASIANDNVLEVLDDVAELPTTTEFDAAIATLQTVKNITITVDD